MYYPMTTSLQVEAHDAWLAEMQKEPSPQAGKTVQSLDREHPLAQFGAWLVSTGQRLQRSPETLAGPDQLRAI